MSPKRESERGSAMVEAAIVLPCLVLILYWSAALTDLLVLKLKAAEALRYALWETTVYKPPPQIGAEVQEKFADLRSPRDVKLAYTSLLMYPLASNLEFSASIQTNAQKVGIGGSAKMPGGTGLEGAIGQVMGGLSRAVDGEMARERFNVFGAATGHVTLVRATHDHAASPILKGGDLPGLKGGNDLGPPPSMTNLSFRAPLPSQREMQLVFDTWKAWPKPAAYTVDGARTDTAVSPMKTYPVVEDLVTSQVDKIAFFGLRNQPWFRKLAGAGDQVSGVLSGEMTGGVLPDVFTVRRMDLAGKHRGQITILPPEKPDVSWAPGECEYRGSMRPCATQRAGDLRTSSASPATLDDSVTLGKGVDRTRYTLPYRINTEYWTASGGTTSGDGTGKSAKLAKPGPRIRLDNAYVDTYRCRGHFFAGSQRGQEADPDRRYGSRCYGR